MRRVVLIAALLPAGFGVAQIAASAPPSSFCSKKPNHPKCVTATVPTTAPTTTVPTTAPPPPPTTTTTVTTAPPPPTTTAPTGTNKANVWMAVP